MDETLFKKVPVKVQRKSGFDLSFQNLLTTNVGTITPVLCEEVIPNETIHLKAALQAQLPPLASDTFMRCDLKYEAFFVPSRLIFKGYEEWLVPGSQYGNSANSTGTSYNPHIPLIALAPKDMQRGSLADYLGVKANIPSTPGIAVSGITSATTIVVNAMPFLGYHKIYNDWYRNSMVQNSIYRSEGLIDVEGGHNQFTAANSQAVVPCQFRTYTMTGGTTSAKYMDNIYANELRQRNFGIDYFTSCTPNAQNGNEQGLVMNVSNSQAGFTIGQLRAANSIQQWLERNNLAGNRLVDYVKANYGANLSDGVAQRSILLGSGQFPVYSKGIYQQSADITQNAVDGIKNPFAGTPGAQFGSAFATGSETIIDSFTASEPGYIFVMVTLVPKVTYSTGVDKKLLRYLTNSRTDMANPMLQGTGNEPVYIQELNTDYFMKGQGSPSSQDIFGYNERYASWKSKNDELHGLLREDSPYFTSGGTAIDTGGTLSSFALQSSFGAGVVPEINSSFLRIPTDYLDNVSATGIRISNYGCWIDSYFDFKVSMPLARYAMPTLQDPAYEHGDDVVLDRGGKRL